MSTPIPKNSARFTTQQVADATGGSVFRGDPGRLHVGVTTDSRHVDRGGIFVALRGERFDGHTFLAAATDAGATLLVVERGAALPSADVAVVTVGDTLHAWGELARAHVAGWKTGGGRIVGVTGSAGKTTTKEMCAALLAGEGNVHATAGNLNNRIGVPAMALGLENAHAFAVLEMGMSERGEIARLAEIATPDVAIVTNIGLAHAGGVGGGIEDVAREKGALFRGIRDGGTAIANADDARVMRAARDSGRAVVTFGRAEDATYRLADRALVGASQSRVRVDNAGRSVVAELPVVGEAAAIDFAAALAAAEIAAGHALEPEDVAAAMLALRLPSGRAAVLTLADGMLLVDDTYNANPASMSSAVASLVEIARREGRRAVAVVGEMRELGDHAERAHVALGEELAAAKVELVIGCGGLADLAVQAARKGGAETLRADDAKNAAKLAVSSVRANDVVLVKASRGVAAEVVVEALVAARGGARS